MPRKRKPAGGDVQRKDKERQKVLAKLTPHLALLRENLMAPDLDASVVGVAKAIGVSKQTLYNHGLQDLVLEVKRDRERALGRVRAARPGARQRIAKLAAEVETWKSRYDALLDRHTRVVAALRTHPMVDLEAILDTPMAKPNRSEPAPGRTRGRHGAHLQTVR